MSPDLIADMRRHAGRIVGYNWDSFGLNCSPLRRMRLVDRYCTFDYKDADVYGLPEVELFSAAQGAARGQPRKYQVSTIVRNHSSRIRHVDEMISALRPESSFISMYEQNVFTFVLNFLGNPRLYLKYRRHVSFKPLSYAEYSEVMMGS